MEAITPTIPRSELANLEMQKVGGRKASAVFGMAWFFANTLVGRALSLATQFVLGWLLLPSEFGIYAFALSISTAIGAIRNGGVSQLLIQQGDRYTERAGVMTLYALAFNTLAMVILCAVAPLTDSLIDSTELPWMLACIGLSFPLGTLGAIFRAKLSIDRRFRSLAGLNTTSALVWQSSAVSLAFLGFGAFSFVLPLLIQAVYESVAGWLMVKETPRVWHTIEGFSVKRLVQETSWIMGSAAVLSLAVTGDYFVVGLLREKEVVGTYFFAFQMVVTCAQLFTNGVETVFPSLLRSLNHDPTKQKEAFFKSLHTLMLTTTSVSVLLSFSVSLLIHFLWSGKWDSAVQATQMLAFSIPAWVVVSLVRALLEAQGLWRKRFLLLAAYGAGGITAAGLGAWMGGATDIALTVAAYYVLFSIGLILTMPRMLDLPLTALSSAVFGPIVLNIACAMAGMFLIEFLRYDFAGPMNTLLTTAVFLTLVVAGNVSLYYTEWRDVLSVMRKSFHARLAEKTP
ncbi:MAG: oligosaccharide flippase family protein [Nitrospira sp.]|nr:oligosaccharide flippase family protein [Nitrospira sp.]